MTIVRGIAVVGLAGLLVGIVVGGLGSRFFMRVAGAIAPEVAQGATTEAGFTIGEITLEGTIALMVFAGIPVGIVGAALTVIFAPWLAWAGTWRGVALGIVFFALGSAASDVMNPDNIDFLLIRNGWLVVATILALFLAVGVAMDVSVRSLDRRLPPLERSGTALRALYWTVAVLGVLLAGLLLPVAFFTDSFCSCDPPVAAATCAVVAGVGTVLSWVATGREGSGLATASRVLGYGGLAGAVGFGLVRAIADASEIVTG